MSHRQEQTTSSHPSDLDQKIYDREKNKGSLKLHFCPDWDFMPVWEGCPEMEGCTCEFRD